MTIVMFDTTQEPTKSCVRYVPIGDYTAALVSDKVVVSQSNPENQYSNMRWKILDGEYEGNVVFFMLHYWNKNPVTKAFADKYLREMCEATGLSGLISTTEELYNKPCIIHVGIDESPGFKPKNVINGWSKIESAISYQPTTTTKTASPSPAVDPLQNMWGKPAQ
ncbi:MAG: hypothetical protein M0R51_11035 [Clostridia bacterium]|nr:hypothetical protein [Clostridia bacterium]